MPNQSTTIQKNVLILHGPNLNMLGKREPEIYGHQTLDDINQQLIENGKKHHVHVRCFQSNAENALIDTIHDAFKTVDFIIFNPAAFTHTSVALRDAILAVNIPLIEVHISNVHKRESFRHHSFFSDVAQAVICGCGIKGYEYALEYACEQLKKPLN